MVPATGLVLCGFGVVTGFAEAATACGVVAVESCFIEVAFAVWVVVSDGAERYMEGGADGVAGEDGVAECLVSACVVATFGGGAPGLVPLAPMCLAPTAFTGWVDRGASVHRADAHGLVVAAHDVVVVSAGFVSRCTVCCGVDCGAARHSGE